MNNNLKIEILQENDLPSLVENFTFSWTTAQDTQDKWNKYYKEQEEKVRTLYLAKLDDEIIGYANLLKYSAYYEFKQNNIPEINDLWIKETHRKQGFAEKLIQFLEMTAYQEGYHQIGIAVGLFKDYGPAQRLYTKMGYVPDGKGVTYMNYPVIPGKIYRVDNDLLLWLTKSLIFSKTRN